MSGVQTITVGPDEAEQRLDRWVRRHFPHVGQGRIEKACRKGEIRVDGAKVKSSSRVAPGNQVRLPPLPDEAEARAMPRAESKVSTADEEMIQSCVLYRDDHIIAINKPSGLASQGGSKTNRHVDGLAEALKFGRDDKPRLVHRLDKDTSGILLLARTQKMASELTAAFRSRHTRKIYWAIVAGVPQPRWGTLRWGLVKATGHGASGEGEKMVCIHPRRVDETPGAKRATTEYAVLETLGSRAAWVALVPVTGRTHQLRAHMAELGHPIAGDGKYGGSSQENLGDGWGSQLGGDMSKKLHLHARSISFQHPVTKKIVTITAPLQDHMKATWDYIGLNENDVPEDPFEELE